MIVIYLVSGGSGRTANWVLRACLAQFPGAHVQLQRRNAIVTQEAALKVVEEAEAVSGVICHALVNAGVRRALSQAALAKGIMFVDLLGPTLVLLGERLLREPLGKLDCCTSCTVRNLIAWTL